MQCKIKSKYVSLSKNSYKHMPDSFYDLFVHHYRSICLLCCSHSFFACSFLLELGCVRACVRMLLAVSMRVSSSSYVISVLKIRLITPQKKFTTFIRIIFDGNHQMGTDDIPDSPKNSLNSLHKHQMLNNKTRLSR